MSTGVPVGGMLVAAAAAAAFELSYALQALEARSVGGPREPGAALLGRLVKRPIFGAALALGVAGYGLQVVALGLAPLTVVQPVLALGLVLLLYLGARLLGERVGAGELGGVGVLVAGVTAIALASPERVVEPALGGALVIALVALALLTLVPAALARRGRAGGSALTVAAGAADAVAAIAAKLISDALSAGRPLAALGWAVAAGAAALIGLSCELAALQQLAITRVAPVVLAMQVAVPVLLAPAIVGERWGATPLGGAVLLAGLVAVTGGAAWLASSRSVGGLIVAESQHEAGGQRK